MHEIGYKGSFAEGKGIFSTGVFYGDWEDIQIEVEIDDPSGQCNTGFAAKHQRMVNLFMRLLYSLRAPLDYVDCLIWVNFMQMVNPRPGLLCVSML